MPPPHGGGEGFDPLTGHRSCWRSVVKLVNALRNFSLATHLVPALDFIPRVALDTVMSRPHAADNLEP